MSNSSTSSESSVSASSSSSIFEALFIDRAPSELSVSILDQNHIILRWKVMKRASGYIIERKENFDEWRVLSDINVNYYEDSEIVPGKYYQYMVRGYIDA
jgi:hypothetical protein